MRPSFLLRGACAPLLLTLVACGQSVGPSDSADVVHDVAISLEAGDAAGDMAPVDTGVLPDAAADAPFTSIGLACTGSGMPRPTQGDCDPGQLCLEDQQGFPMGYCVQDCSNTMCPAGSACITVGGNFQLCLRTCAMSSDCRDDEGYACRTDTMSGQRVCLPGGAPVGTRANGDPCYTTAAGAHQIPALQHRTFASPNALASAGVGAAAEGNVVVSPMNHSVALSFIGEGRGGAFMGSSTTTNGTAIVRNPQIAETQLPDTSDPVLAYTSDGKLYMTYIAYTISRMTGMMSMGRIRVASSTDDGHTWSAPVGIEPVGTCAGGCDKPWIVSGPGPNGMGENIYVAYLSQSMTAANIMLERSEDAGMTWSAPVIMASVNRIAGDLLVPNLNTMVVAPDGTLHVTYIALSAGAGMTANFGNPANRVWYRSSSDGGRTFGTEHRVSSAMDSPVYEQPVVAIDGTTIYVAYISGPTTGAWDLMLATSTDGGVTWRARKVNDEPDSCATHAFAWVAADTTRHVAHVMWMENRFGPGDVAYAACPRDASMACGRNELVSDQPFAFTTGRDPMSWHGDYDGLALGANGDLWALWSDTRSMLPQMYLAHGTLQ